ncbi:MAG TPA: cation diffusion facilitator family transporter, partial [Thermoanaerobaculia bacterium]|nr:cation diffusion facilitator family transporter [Thermoanaerobaculia bacterium]
MRAPSSRVVVFGAMIANLAIAAAKLAAALVTKSSAMLAEGIHSIVDTANEVLLLLGQRRSRRPPDDQHPFGHGKELYFWGLIVAVLLFGLGGGFAIFEGIEHLKRPADVTSPAWNYVVLGIAFVAESISWTIARRKLRRAAGGGGSLFGAARASKDPAVFLVLGEDTAALAGLVIAFLGVFLRQVFDAPALDGIASILIGLVLSSTAFCLSWQMRGLLVGSSADEDVVKSVEAIVANDPEVES